MVIDFWVNALSKEAAAAFLGKSGFASVEGFFGVDVKEGMAPAGIATGRGPWRHGRLGMSYGGRHGQRRGYARPQI
jgi:hypothetical protein